MQLLSVVQAKYSRGTILLPFDFICMLRHTVAEMPLIDSLERFIDAIAEQTLIRTRFASGNWE